MIDKINLVLKNIESSDIEEIKQKTNFDFHHGLSKRQRINSNPNFDGYFIKIDEVKRKIYVELSLHKFYNYIANNSSNNYTQYTYRQLLETVQILKTKLHKNIDVFNVTYYEIGLNLYVSKEPIKYMKLIKRILTNEHKKEFYINPIVNKNYEIITEMDRNKKRVFKCYDKVYEMQVNRKKEIPEYNILRIESINRGVTRLVLSELIHPANFVKVSEKFEYEWKTTEFERILNAPSDITAAQKGIINIILQHGNTDTAIKHFEDMQNLNIITPDQMRRRTEFIKTKWNDIKTHIFMQPTEEEKEFRYLLNNQLLFSKQ